MKVIYVTGNAGAGKTMFSYFLACKLATSGKKCAIVSTGATNPDVPLLLPECKEEKSLGRLLANAVISQRDIYKNMWLLNKNSDMGIFCYAVGETPTTYPAISSTNLSVFFTLLGNTVDYIVVDSSTEIDNTINKYVIDRADNIFCLTTANLKGLAYRKAKDIDNDSRVTHILFQNSPMNPYDDIRSTFGRRVNHEMPYCKSLDELYNGTTLDDMEMPKAYSKFLYKLVKEVVIDEKKAVSDPS